MTYSSTHETLADKLKSMTIIITNDILIKTNFHGTIQTFHFKVDSNYDYILFIETSLRLITLTINNLSKPAFLQ